MMNLTAYHAKLFAHELTKRSSSDNVDKLASALSDAQVDLNPHQIEAALFAFRSPLSKGAILADEVGLGKTIEAGILLAQHWAERRRTLLVICPANLRKQWSQELLDKFFLPSVILETKTFNEAIRSGNLNPFQQSKIIICSFQFACSKEPYLRNTPWNLIVIDEAHRLRNVYKPSNKVANSIKNAVSSFQKVLLTATPLQNSLLELYGLVSIVDEFTFGDLRSFRAQFSRLSDKADFDALKQRLRPICQRTLRRQVLAYVPYTNRHAMVQEFYPSAAEQQLYELVSEYLKGDKLYALPASQRQLMTLILRKLLASSTYAISDTLLGLANKLGVIETEQQKAADVSTKAAFHRMLELSMLWGLLPAQRNPLSLVEIKGGTTRPRRKKFILTPEQFQQLCNLLEEPYRTMVIIAMCLGLRVSEILALKWPDFDFEEGTLMITRGTVHGRIGRVKTEYSEDEMPLDPAFAHIIQKWRMQCPASEGRWVFPNPNTGGVWHSSVLQGDILVPAGKKIGVLRLGWHTFRHSYRSLLDACGAPIGVQQKLMRHAQVSTTMKYGDAYMGEKRKAHSAVVQMVLPTNTAVEAEIRSVSA